MSSEGVVHVERDGGIVTITFDRPEARNAMTWTMYEALSDACARIDEDDSVRVVVLRGAGEEAFVAGTDIAQFQSFETGEDGVRYNQRVDPIFDRLESLRPPTIAVGRGAVVGGGLAIAASCDLRLVSDDARLGIPVARTLGNLPSMSNISRVVALVGPAKTKELLFTARLLSADEALAAGLVTEVHPGDVLDTRVAELCEVLQRRAPLTIAGVKEAVRRIVAATTPDGEDIIREVYGSEDFREGMSAFLEKRRPEFKNR